MIIRQSLDSLLLAATVYICFQGVAAWFLFFNVQFFWKFLGENHEPLSWGLRVQIALDVARGLEYLHDGVSFEFSNAARSAPVFS